ncbi:MAG: hypothetical protein M1546_14305 [Chloroflexi bacterium]|nr:hypothetical protein [Chloroflexota bacterium]
METKPFSSLLSISDEAEIAEKYADHTLLTLIYASNRAILTQLEELNLQLQEWRQQALPVENATDPYANGKEKPLGATIEIEYLLGLA